MRKLVKIVRFISIRETEIQTHYNNNNNNNVSPDSFLNVYTLYHFV